MPHCPESPPILTKNASLTQKPTHPKSAPLQYSQMILTSPPKYIHPEPSHIHHSNPNIKIPCGKKIPKKPHPIASQKPLKKKTQPKE